MCVFCPISYCDQHADGTIKTRSFCVGGGRIRHRVCMAHENVPSNAAKAQHRRSSKLKGREVLDSDANGITEPDIPMAVKTENSSISVEENVGTFEVNESMTEVSMSVLKDGNDDSDVNVTAVQELEKLNSKPRSRNHHAEASSRHTSSMEPQSLRVKPAADQKQESVVARLRKKNGISLDAVDAGTLSSPEPVVEKDSCQSRSEKTSRSEELTESSMVKSPGKRCKAPVLNGFHSSVSISTRRRSALQERSQTWTVPADKLEMPVNGSMVDTVSALLLEELSGPKDLKLVNGKEHVVDGN